MQQLRNTIPGEIEAAVTQEVHRRNFPGLYHNNFSICRDRSIADGGSLGPSPTRSKPIEFTRQHCISTVRHGMPAMIGNAWPSSGQNQQSLRSMRAQPLIGETNFRSIFVSVGALSTTTTAASLSGFELCRHRSMRRAGWPRCIKVSGNPRTYPRSIHPRLCFGGRKLVTWFDHDEVLSRHAQ